MKKFILLAFAACLSFTSCKKDEKKEENTAPEKTESTAKKYVVDPSSSTIQWTAYKTTAKTPVTGKFTQLTINNPVEGDSKQAALQGLNFEIPISSFFSDNEERDNKIKQLFWAVMKDTSIINGTFKRMNGDDTKGIAYVTLVMNQIAQDVTMTYTVDGNKINIEGAIFLTNWKVDEAFDSLHKACELLHTGEDGISKTWEEVAIKAVAVIKEK